MTVFLTVVFPILGVVVAWYQFRAFPWKQQPKKVVYAIVLLTYLSIGALLGLLAAGWLAGQFSRIAAG